MTSCIDSYLKIVGKINDHMMDSSNKFTSLVAESERIYVERRKNFKKSILESVDVNKKNNSKLEDKEDELEDDQLKHKTAQVQMMHTVCNWWDLFVQQRYPQTSCLEYFRCSRKTYIHLVTTLRPYIQPKIGIAAERHSLNMIKGVSVEKQVAILLYKLSRSADYASISSMFGVHKSTVHKSLYKTIMAMNKHMLYKNIYMPDSQEAKQLAQLAEEKCKIPQVIGAIQSLHIPIVTTQSLAKVFNNSAGYSSAIMQCVVDPNYVFRDLSIRYPGSAEQQSILEHSKLFSSVDRVIPKDTKNINGTEVSYKICADCSYPLLNWLLPSYIVASKQGELIYNECINDATNFVYEAFNRLRSRFTILSHAIDISYKITPQIIGACCIIHNICEKSGDAFLDEWQDDVLLDRYPQPEKIIDESEPEASALEQRETICEYLESTLFIDEVLCVDGKNVQLLIS